MSIAKMHKCDFCNASMDMYMVNKDLWKSTGLNKEFICIDCFQNILGRNVEMGDFSICPCTNDFLIIRSIGSKRADIQISNNFSRSLFNKSFNEVTLEMLQNVKFYKLKGGIK